MNRGNLRAIFVVYLTGLLLGGLYVGMIAPVRLVIQEQFGLNDSIGIWVINIYTLFYAACIPIIGKLADMRGRKPVFLGCLTTFALGSTVCGIAQYADSFALLLAGRLAQAIGACGIIPVANAEIGATFPQEKRGMALGIAAAVAGIANVLGAAVGSAVIGIVGAGNWAMLFFFALPVCVALIIVGRRVLPSTTSENGSKIDGAGSVLMVATVLLLLLSLQGIDCNHVASSLQSKAVVVPAIGFVACGLAFAAVERRTANPVFNLSYLKNKPIVITMVVSFFVGGVTITMSLIPEVAEFIMNAPVGSGGIYILPVGVMCMFGPPLGGKLIDCFGPKPVLVGGLSVAGIGFLFIAFISLKSANAALLIAGLSLMGLGMGFAMGAPTNYMILENTSPDESGSAIATIALVRQIGATVAPAILLGFVTAAPGADGFFRMLLCATVFCLVSLIVMLFYRGKPSSNS